MPFIYRSILTLALLLPFLSFGQKKSYNLYGVVKTDAGEVYPYHVVFDLTGNKLSGYSVTTQMSGIDFIAKVSGLIDRKLHKLVITEVRALDHNAEAICLFDADLTYKQVGDKFIVSGPFIGRNVDSTICGIGTVEIEEPNDPVSIFYVPEKKQPLRVPEKPTQDTVAIKPPAASPNTITEGVEKEIDWTSDTCVLEVWDGGVIDGDVITVLYNDLPVLANYTLEKAHKQLRIPITKKTSTVTIIAIDEGANPPNTADILLIDGTARYKVTAYNSKGKRAVIVLRKK